MSRNLLLCIFLFLFSGFSQSLRAQPTTVFTQERISVGIGLGVEYAMLGVHGKYFFSDYLGLTGSTDFYFQDLLWQVGLEFRVPEEFPKRFSPYLKVSYGTNSYAQLEGFTFMPLSSMPQLIFEKEAFLGITMGAGFKWDIFNKNNSYLSVGFNYRFIDKGHAVLVDSFNTAFITDFRENPYRLLPSIGFVLCINRKRK